MATYRATLKSSTYDPPPVITVEGTLPQAKRAATKEFGMGYLSDEIIIYDDQNKWVARRCVEDDRWSHPVNDAPLIHQVGRALYGTEWQSDMARDLNLNTRTVQRYAAGTSNPSAGVKSDLAGIIEDRITVLGALLEDIKNDG